MKINLNDNNIFKKVMLLFTVLISTVLYSQTYPVQVTPQLIPPYSLKISDYATTSSEKLYANILLTDVNEVGRRIRLKMYIEGQGLSITTRDVIAGETPIYLDGGINLRLSNLDLQAYFQLNNLVGITPGQYNAPLPNGGYDFCFEVYDYFTNRKLSSKSCTTVYLLQNDPPILNLPFKDNIVNATNPQNVLFTWTPRHSNASNVQYEFTLKELWDVQNPQANFLASVPFYQTNTYSTTLLVGPEAPQLLSGKIYGWQVRAFVSDGINETSVFKNDGKSEIFWFKYLEDCQPPSFVISQALTAESVQVNWQSSEHLRYRIQYRKKGFGDDDWFEVNSYTNEGKIRNLEPATVYEFRVGGECTQLSGFAYSNIQEFTTPSSDEAAYYNCGLMPQINITNKEPLPKLGINETFTAGDFPVTTREVTGSNGTFSGWGYITLPFLENLKEIIDAANIATGGEVNIGKYTRIKVVFDNVQINSSYELIDGVVETDYDPDWKGIIDTDEIIDDIGGDRGNIENFDATNTDIKDVKVDENGNVVIIPEEGEPIPIETQKPVTITDKNGDQWTVHEDGTVTKGKAAEGGAPTADNTEGISNAGNVKQITSKDVEVTFNPSGYYGTDFYQKHIKPESYKNEYEFIKKHDDSEYSVLYKLLSDLPEHKTDIIKATVNFSNGKTKDDIVFKTKEGTAITPTWSGNEATLPLQRKFEFTKEEILATVKPKDSTGKYTVAGKLNVWHAQQQTINLTLVSVDGASVSNVEDRINEIYNKAGIHFNIKKESINLGLGSLDVGDSDMLSNYTEGEKSIISTFKNGRTIAKNQYYMFFLDKEKTTLSKDLDGFMPLKRQFGFVFTQQDAGRIAAHELGHGIFGLKHPFDQYNAESAKNENHYLMSYGTGTAFSHMDWQKLHAPGIQLYWFQGDEAGEIGKMYWLTPNWEPFTVSNTRSISTKIIGNKYVQGSVPGFVIKDSVETKTYYAKFDDYGSFKGYYSDAKKEFYNLKTFTLKENDSISVFNYNGACKSSYYRAKWKNVKGGKGKTPIVSENLRSSIKLIKCNQESQSNNCNSFVALSSDNEGDKKDLNNYQLKLNQSLKNAVAEIQGTVNTEVRDKGIFSHIQFINANDVSVLNSKKNFEILEDKLHLLAHYTNTYFVVSLLKLETNNTSIPTALLSEMAEKSITANKEILNGKKVVHLVVSSSNYESIFGVGLFNNDVCYSMGYAQSEQDIVLTSAVEKGTSPFADIINVYKTIEKPLNVYATVVKSDFSIHTLEKKSRSTVRGFPLINVLTTLKSPYVDEINEKLRERKRLGDLDSDATIAEKLEYERKFVEWKEKYDALILKAEKEDEIAIKNNNKDYFVEVKGKIELREVYITSTTLNDGLQMKYAKFHFDKDENFDFVVNIAYTFGNYNQLDSKKHFYDGEINPNEVIYGMIDAASLFFAPVGLDTVFDFVGLAFASYNGDAAKMGEYSVGLVMVGYAQYGTKALTKFKLVKSRLKEGEDVLKYSIKDGKKALDEGEEFVAEVIGRDFNDAKNRLKSEGFVIDIIDGVGEISAANHMLVLGGDFGKTTERLRAIESQTTDDVIDIVVHGADNKIIVDGKEVTDNITNIKKWLEDKHPTANKVRLLSCTNLEGAQDFANKLGDKFTVQATDGYIRVHNDGLVTVVPRNKEGGTEWFELAADRQKKVLPENARPRGPDESQLDNYEHVDDFLELSTRTLDEINWAKLEEVNPELINIINTKFADNLDEKAKFVEDLFNKVKVSGPPQIGIRSLISNSGAKSGNLQKLTEAHVDAWRVLREVNPGMARGFDNLDGFSNILPRFNKLTKNEQDDFLKVITTTSVSSESKPYGGVKQAELLINNIKNLEDEHIDVWLELRKYADEVNSQYNFDMINKISLRQNTVENAVIYYGKRGENLAALLQKFGYENCYASVKQAGNVSTNNKKLLKALTGAEYDRVKELYRFNVDGKEYVVKGDDWEQFFNDLVSKGNFNGFQSHHILVIELFKSPGYRKWYEAKGVTNLDINGENTLGNLIMLEGFANGKGVHANHTNYNDAFKKVIDDRWSLHLTKGEQAAINALDKDIKNMQEGVKKLLEEKCVKGTYENGVWLRTKVDDLIRPDGRELFQMLD